MDVDELDAWLGTGEDHDGESAARSQWDEARPRSGRRPDDDAPRGRRWPLIAGAGLLVWLLVMVLLAAGGTTDEEAATEDLFTADPAAPTPGAAPTTPPTPGSSPGPNGSPAPVGTAAPPPVPAASGAVTDDSAAAGGVAVHSSTTGWDEVSAAAVLAVRRFLTELDDGIDRYVEWGAPIGTVALDGSARVVHVEAVWLEGSGGAYERAVHGRWAVPVRADGASLGQPWAINRPDREPAPPLAPPVLRQRVEEVRAALAGAGWSEVVVHGSEPHPEVEGAWVALVDGTDPTGILRVGAVVWLVDLDGLVLPGAAS